MKNILLFLAFFALVNFGYSQTTFEKTYDNGSLDYGNSVISLADGYIMCGETLDDVNGDFDVFVTKVDLNGDVVWTNIYTSLGVGDDYATYINETSDGNFVITGNTTDASGNQDVFILKIQNDGTELWNQTYDGGNTDEDGANYITEGESNTLLVCGYSYDGNYSDMWVFQTDANGNFQWENFYGLNGDDEATCVNETDDGGLAIVGQSYDDANGDYDGVLIKTDANGDEVWTYYTTGAGDEIFNDFIIDNDGDFLIVGAEEDVQNGDYDLLLENVSSDGNTVNYSYTFDYLAGNDEAYRVYSDGTDFFIAGYVEDILNDDLDAYLAQIDVSNGDIIGEVAYGDIYDDEFKDFDFTDDNGFICVGYQTINANYETNVYLVKTDENGNVANTNELIRNTDISVYPNPSSDVINISSIEGVDSYKIITVDGKTIQENELTSNQINIENLQAGVYLLELKIDKQVIVKKFIKK